MEVKSTLWHFSSEGLKVNFCPECGSLLDIPGTIGNVTCTLCEFTCPTKDLAAKEIITRSKRQLPVSGRLKRENKDKESRPLVHKVCEVCGHDQLYFSTAQLRSADEGQTIFYECPKCGDKHSVNS